MDIWRSLSGELEVTLTSAQPEEELHTLAMLGLTLENLEKTDSLTYRFRIPRQGWRTVKAFCARRGDTLTLEKRRGLYWRGKRLLSRPVLVFGLGLLLGLTLYLPGRVLFVEVEGNQLVPTRRILEAAEDCGLSFGASRRDLRSEKVKNALLVAVPELQWAGVNTRGCVATISVRERAAGEDAREEAYTGIVAARDGYLLSITTTQGTALCAPGQAVTAGQTLISGYTDCGLCIRFDGAQGEIVAQTSRSIRAVMPLIWQETGQIMEVKKKISLTIGKKRIIFWKDSGILQGSCGRMVSRYDLTLPGGFSLPVTLWLESYPQAAQSPGKLPAMEAALPDLAVSYLEGQMTGGTIESRRETLREEGDLLVLDGEYVCVESIGRGTTEQMEDIHGKTD